MIDAAPAAAPVIESLEDRVLMSRSWFVAPYGNDANAGTLAKPFRTIQRAATLANWGDSVLIRGGTYRETVHPAHGGVTFQNYNRETVTVSGADVISGFSGYRGAIYRSRLPWNLGEGSNQVFVDGQMINEARWPNSSLDLSHPYKAHIQSLSGGWGKATIYDKSLSAGWQGGMIHILPGNGWYAQTGTVVASGRGWLTFTYRVDNSYTVTSRGNAYYVTGSFQGLDGPGEWYRDNGGNLYIQTPRNDNPARHLVEARHRQYAFDLSWDPNIVIRGINIFAAGIKTDGGSRNLIIDHMDAKYVAHFTTQPIGWQQPWDQGIGLNGVNSLLENSNISYSAGDGVYVSSWARGSRVTNCIIHDVDYNDGDSAGIRSFAPNAMFDHNTIYNAGRCGIIDRAAGTRVLNNLIHDVMLQTSDGGGIYTINQNGGGGEIAYNMIYNVHAGGYGANGIFLDDNSSNWMIHNNTIYNTDAAVKLNYTARGVHVYSNNLTGNQGSVVGNGRGDWHGTVVSNNILHSAIHWPGAGAVMYANRYM